MSRVSFLSDIVERRTAHGALVVTDEYRFRAAPDNRLSPKGEELAEKAALLGLKSGADFVAVKNEFHRIIAEAKEQLNREKVLLITLNDERTRALSVAHVTIMEAAIASRTVPGDLIGIDSWMGGLHVSGLYIILSERYFDHGIEKYGPRLGDILSGLLKEWNSNPERASSVWEK